MLVVVYISFALLVAYGILLAYYFHAWNSIPYFNARESITRPLATKISVIIPARNEAQNIAACIGSLARQTYPPDLYEVIVVDDHSTDGTWTILNGLTGGSIKLVPLRLADFTSGKTNFAYKKFAIDTAIQAASGELIVTTDADCEFNSDWLKTIAQFYTTTQAKFIAAPVKIKNTASWLSVFQTLDFITLQGITGASVFKKMHSMCNGANLAYEKNAFYEVGGFRDIDQVPSGDDMLLMHKIFLKYPEQVFFLKNREAIVYTKPETTWKGFINQRVRWASKADKYDDKRIFRVLVLVFILNALFFLLLIASCGSPVYLLLFLVLLLIKTSMEYPFTRAVSTFFDQQKLMLYFPFFQPFHIIYTVVIGLMGKFGSYRWKERKVG